VKKIKFTDVGRQKWDGEITIEDNLNADQIAELAYRRAREFLVSAYPDIIYDAEKNIGTIFAGFHTVGSFCVEVEK